MAKTGRPSKYSDALMADILAKLGNGTPLAEICRGEGMPAVSTVWQWEQDRDGLSESIARARRDGFDAIAMRARLTARSKAEAEGGDSTGDVQRDKLIIETDLKLLAKWDPKRYGDLIKLSGADGQSPIPLVTLNADMTAAQAAEAYAKLIG